MFSVSRSAGAVFAQGQLFHTCPHDRLRLVVAACVWLLIVLARTQVGPFPNPQETYAYYSLPFCRPDGDEEHFHSEGLGETILGYNLIKCGCAVVCTMWALTARHRTPMKINFKENKAATIVCKQTLTQATAKQFQHVRDAPTRDGCVLVCVVCVG